MTGQPALNVPVMWTEDGRPIGMQLAGRFGREDVLLRLAAQLEQARPWSARMPPVLAAA
jgi:amidase